MAGPKRYAVWWKRQRDDEAGHDATLHCVNLPPRLLAARLKEAIEYSGPVVVYRVEEQ